jgi:hypothetical protein
MERGRLWGWPLHVDLTERQIGGSGLTSMAAVAQVITEGLMQVALS